MSVLETLFERALHLEKPWQVREVEFVVNGSRLNVTIDFAEGSEFACPRCDKRVKAYDTSEKEWRHLNFFQYDCYLRVRIPRIECEADGVLQVKVDWARESADFTLLFESMAMSLCREMPVNKVSQIIGVDDNKLWRMLHYYVESARQLEDYSLVKSIGMDETSQKKGHDYVTLGVDLSARKTIFVGQGKGAEVVAVLKEDFQRHGGFCEQVRDVSMDMSPAFIKGVQENFPKAEITFDKFHVMKILNQAVDDVRKSEVKEYEVLKQTKYLWLKNRENLTQSQQETLKKIESMPSMNLKTVRAMHLRENFQQIYQQNTQEEFESTLKQWYFWATHCRIEPIRSAAKTIKNHWQGVLRWYESKINNGILEGLNSVIQAAKAKARGYRTFKNFRAIIYLITGKLNFAKVGLPT